MADQADQLTQNERDYWQEDANRLNDMAKTAQRLGVQVDVKAKTPKLSPDGSLKDKQPKGK